MSTSIQDPIETMVTHINQRKGIHFSNEAEARRHIERAKSEIIKALKTGGENLLKGLTLLKQLMNTHCEVADISNKLLKSLQSTKKLSWLIETKINANYQALSLFANAVSKFCDGENYDEQECVIGVFMALFPANPQPYVFYASMIWRRDGIQAAQDFYDNLTEIVDDPGLYYFAADCHFKNDHPKEARHFLKRCLDHPLTFDESYHEVRRQAHELLTQC